MTESFMREIGGSVAAQLEACTRCGMCADACPFYTATGNVEYTPIWKLELLRRVYEQRFTLVGRLKLALGLDQPVTQADLEHWRDLNYRACTTCNRCSMTCPMGITVGLLMHNMRAGLAGAGVLPENLRQMQQTVGETYNVYGYPTYERAGWVEYMLDAPDDLYQREQAEVVYFVGCVSSLSPGAQRIAEAFVRVLDAAGVDFTILGEEEVCCGFPLRAAGLHGAAEELIQMNADAIAAKGAHTVVFTCPACRLMWLKEYAAHLPDVRPLHATELLAELIEAGRLELNGFDATATYHDPCDLARTGGVYEAPRQVLKAIPGLELREVDERRESGLCCGGGGDVEMVAPDMVKKVAEKTTAKLAGTGAEVLATACPQCMRVLDNGLKEAGRDMRVLDVTEIVAQAVGLD